jgi:transcriptional regulator with XRE-family HTH domain
MYIVAIQISTCYFLIRMESLGQQIKNIRKQYDLSQDRFGKRLGLSGKSISAYETDKAKPSLRVLERISNVYEVSIYDLPKSKQQDIEKRINEVFEAVNDLRNSLKEGLTL